jgi:membrane-associated phospholipid phosphatase
MDGRMISAMTALAALCATCLLSAIIQYTATARGGVELIDHTLLAIDRALGFDWFAFVAFIDQSKLVSDLLLMCYMSIGVQMVAILVVFLYRQDYEGVDAYIIGLVILIGVACVVCAWLPAIGITGIVDVSFENTPVAGGRAGQPSFLDLRSGALRTVDLNWMNGLITFPSGHAAFAFMTTLAARRAPYAFWPFAVVNLLMIVSTLTHGGHYLCDLIAGGFLAAAAWWTGSRLATLPLNGVRKLVGMTARP